MLSFGLCKLNVIKTREFCEGTEVGFNDEQSKKQEMRVVRKKPVAERGIIVKIFQNQNQKPAWFTHFGYQILPISPALRVVMAKKRTLC
jgi:hypothetical protein